MWLGIVVFADHTSDPWMRVAQAVIGLLLAAWAVRKAASMIGKA
ncbi:hypothetical protein ABZ297_42505 [Nonomuraea sp. NPDC005983]